jgi:hypothetical protein
MRRSEQTRFERYGRLYRWTGIAVVIIWLSFDPAIFHSFTTMFHGAAAIGRHLESIINSTNNLSERESRKTERK